MSRLFLTSDLHLGHNNIVKYRTNFCDAEDHHYTLFENLANTVTKRDTVYFLGDVAFTKFWLDKIKNLKCRHKKLIVGNHDTERGITMRHLVDSYDSVESLISKRNYWLSHAPIHPSEIRGKIANIHGHTHKICIDDPRYINVCVEQTQWKPVCFEELMCNRKL